jgi:alpha-galactosidase
MLDLGNPQARQWLKNMLAGYIDELGIKWIRYDCNLTPLVFWDKNDEPDRKGILEIRHIEGLYEVWDWLNETYPDLILEGCASGGRRIDFEAIKRCHLFVSSDQNLNPNLVRNHLHGANRILPGRYHNVLFGPNILVDYPDYYYHSYFGGSLQISDPLTQWDEKIKQTTIKHLKAYKRIRHLINEDVNLPFGDPTDLTKWQGWQHYKNDCSEGVLIAFRLRSEAEYTHVMLKGIDESAEYVIEDLYTGKTQPILGTDLAQGIKIELDTNGSRIVYYKRV